MVSKTETFSVVLNFILHVLILWSILTFFFFLFASKLSTSALNNELGSYIDKGVPESLNSLSESQKQKLSFLLRQVPLKNLINFTSQPSEIVVLNNSWNYGASLVVIASLAILFIVVATIIKASCDPQVSLTHIIIENFFTFLFVGIVEFLFFKYVALKYIPIAPSVITDTLIDRLKFNMTQ